jgi:hypothetical protein
MRSLHPTSVTVLVGISVLSLLGCGVQAEPDFEETEASASSSGEAPPGLKTAQQELKSGTTVTLSAGHSGQCMDIAGGSTQGGGLLVQWPCNGGDNQRFKLMDMGDGTYNIVAMHSGLCLEAHDNTWGTLLYQWTCHGGENQRFRLQDRGGGYYQIQAKYTGLCLDVAGASNTPATNTVQWGCNGAANQSFSLGLPARSATDKNACTAGLGDGKSCAPNVQISGIVPYANCVYGFHVGAGWGSGTAAFYDEVDRCAFWHDSGCWNVNRFTGVDEGNGGCSQTVNFIHCVERIIPSTQEEAAARSCVLNSLLAVGANICEPFGRGTFYPLYDATTTGGRCAGAWSYP